ncbi:MAG: hypothetical protein ACTSUF_06200 [Candidatus Heimdallarchaeaceae archaeon]
MRKHFFNYLIKLADADKDIVLLTGDLGYSFYEDFAQKHPDKFINCGCMEQTMIGIAAGLALAGKKPYVYSTIPFLVFRAYEQIRNDICYNNLNVKLIGVSMSGFIGFTHEISEDEDIKVLEHLPNLKIKIPNNEYMLGAAIGDKNSEQKPTYIRI